MTDDQIIDLASNETTFRRLMHNIGTRTINTFRDPGQPLFTRAEQDFLRLLASGSFLIKR
jgi:hypothetical protein